MSNLTEITDRIHDLNIVNIISSYGVSLKKKGVNHQACCPFHNEKTPSFSVNENKGIFKCFGCGKGGDAITFVMEHQKLSFTDAVREIAQKNGLPLPEQKSKEETEKAEQEYKHKQSLYLLNNSALDYFLKTSIAADQLNYINSRISADQKELFMVGYATDDWHGLHNSFKAAGFNEELMLELGLLSESKGKRFDFFRNRMIFPIHDHRGRVVAFTGRVFGDEKPKYLNSPDSRIFKKGKVLYGLFHARETIVEKGFVYRVEGPIDVISMHANGIKNVICPNGTALTIDQVNLLKQFTNTVVLFTDGDEAGEKALLKDGKLFIECGFNVSVLLLSPDQDPDSLLKSGIDFNEYTKNNTHEYLVWLALKELDKAHTVSQKADVIDKICQQFIKVDNQTKIDYYIDLIIKHDKQNGPRKKWTDKLRSLKQDVEKEEKRTIPKDASIEDFEKYGFYEERNCYWFNTRNGNYQGSNFSLKPLFHVESTVNAKRLFEMKNEYGHTRIIELSQKDLISLGQFRLKVESIGNFIWMLGEAELTRLKVYLYEKTQTCTEITQLGWQKEGFWAWGNGIFQKEFKQVNKYGIVSVGNNNYYLPAFSTIFEHDADLFTEERKYKYFEPEKRITLKDHTEQLISVFGDNAKICMCYLVASLFRDVIISTTGFFPILNLFGPKGAGKSEMAKSMLQFFGGHKGGPNITNTSKAALAQYVGHISNGLVHLEEYKNNMADMDKYEFLKGLWDGTGRTVMNMERDRKKETSAVDTGVMLTGQEMPTIDIALFSRLIFLTFTQTTYNEDEKISFNQLKRTEKNGITYLTHEILSHRLSFEENWHSSYKEVSVLFNEMFAGDNIQDRIYRNWLVIIAAYRTIEDKLHLPFGFQSLLDITKILVKRQNKETEKGDEVSTFWNIVQYMVAEGHLIEGVDFRVEIEQSIETDKGKFSWTDPKRLLYLNHNRVFLLYRKHGTQSKESILPVKSLEFYLKNHNSFLGKKKAVAFKTLNPVTKSLYHENDDNSKKRMITTALLFFYDSLHIDIMNTESDNRELVSFSEKKEDQLSIYPFEKELKESVF